ncbi:uncharacterized protein LOC128241233 [Mya arenaria]|uniref:uncharacterized protein LOC128241233 n=1 Tax=Mya arenaria TaxID=6604 RepID=UPI0022E202A4|nr:uncharacterized protein LOC128241233 [Mya arenaria]
MWKESTIKLRKPFKHCLKINYCPINKTNFLFKGESVGDVSVSVTGSVVTYADSDATFDVDSATGAVTTASGVTLDKATKAEHTVTITGTVTGGESNDLTLTVKVGDCSGKEKMTAALGSVLLSMLAYTLLSL